jgi:hypothetical protein
VRCGHGAEAADGSCVDDVSSCFEAGTVGSDTENDDFVFRHRGETASAVAERQEQPGRARSNDA